MIWLRAPLFGMARWIWIIAALALAVLAVWWVVATLTDSSTAKTEARLSENQTEAALANGTDAVQSVGRTTEYERRVDIITRETERVIREAPGADAPIDPDLQRLAIERLCLRTAYREHPECLLDAPTP